MIFRSAEILFIHLILLFIPISIYSAPGSDIFLQSNYSHDFSNNVSYYLKKGKKFLQSNPDSAWFYFEKAHKIALQSNDKQSMSLYFSNAVSLLNNEGKFDSALELGEQMINIGIKLKDTLILIKGFNDAANEYEYLGDFQQASMNYLKALKLADKLNNHKMQRKLNNNIASVFIELKDYKQANLFAGTAYRMSVAENDTAEEGSSLLNLGVTEIHLRKYDDAVKHFDEVIGIGIKIKDETLIGDARLNLGDLFLKQKKPDLAQIQYEKVLNISEKLKLPYYKLYALFSLAILNQGKKNFKQAEIFTRNAISIGEKIGAAEELREMYDTLSVILEKSGQIKDALYYRKKYETLSDSLMNAKVKTNINRLQIQYNAAKKDKEIAEQKLNLEKSKAEINQKNILVFILLGSISALIIILLLSIRSYRNKKKLHEQSLLTLQRENELKTVRAQMIAREEERNRIGKEIHDDIGSALTTIMYLSSSLKAGQKNKSGETIDKISSISNMIVNKMNEIVWSMNKDYDTLDDLITYIRYHAAELIENNGLEYQFNVSEEIPSIKLNGEKRRNIYLSVKEALHNIVKHAGATEVIIDLQIDHVLSIKIKDNGKGFKVDPAKKFGNGLKNMRHRIEIIGGKFSIYSKNGTTVCFTLPLETTKEK